MKYQPVNFENKFSLFKDHWSPKIIARMNNIQFKLVKFQGEFVWHRHEDTDETFMVMEGQMGIDFRDGRVILNAGEMFVVPKGVEHKRFADKECKIMLVEPAGVVNTGEADSELTADNDVWI